MNLTTLKGLRQVPWALVVVWILVIASVITWRKGVIFSGALDIVVIAKALVALIAAFFAALMAWRAPARRRVGGISLGFIAVIVAISLLGAFVSGELTSSAVLVARILLLALTIILLVSIHPSMTILWTLLTAMGAVGLFAAATGYQTYLANGRLNGGIPPLAANELAALVLPPIIGLVFYVVRHGLRWWAVTLLAVLAGCTYATGSRTGLAVMILGMILALLFARPLTSGVMISVLATIPVVYIVVGFTDVLSNIISRGEDLSKLVTLNSRSIAWEAVLSTPSDTWQWWIGAGLSIKKIAVTGQYWDEQVFDSSWVSSIAQAGMIGTAVLAVFVLFTFVQSARNYELRGLTIPLLALTLLRSILENGLVESSATFALFFTIAVVLEPGTSTVFVASHQPIRAVIHPFANSRRLVYPTSWLTREPHKSSPDGLFSR